MGDPDLPVYRYVKNWGRRGDAGVVASDGPNAYGAAWYRLFPASAPGWAGRRVFSRKNGQRLTIERDASRSA